MTKGILDGIRVFEISHHVAIPYAGRMLASQGAEVIKASTGRNLEFIWLAGPEPRGSGMPDYEAMKRHIALDMRFPESPAVAREVVKASDVFLVNFSRESINRWGLDYESVKAINPRVIMVWVSGFGIEGPYRDYGAYGGLLPSAIGLAEVTGFPDGAPTQSTAFADYHTAAMVSLLVVAALDRRRATGEGCFIEVPLYEVGVSTVNGMLMDYLANGRIATRVGNRDPMASPHGAYPCLGEDRWCVIAVSSEAEWAAFCRIVGPLPWTQDPRFDTLLGRIKYADELDRLVAEWTATRTAEDVMESMQKAGVPAGVVAKGRDLLENEHLNARGFFKMSMYPRAPFGKDDPDVGPTPTMSVPIRFSETPTQFGPTRRLAEDNDYIYHKIAGIPHEEIQRLTDKGVLK